MEKEYYIQGDPARAEEIKAAFEEKGCTLYRLASKCDSEDLIYYSLNGIVRGIKKDNLYLFEAHPGYKELPLPVKSNPKFKPGTWLWHKTKGVLPLMVEDYDEKEGYLMLMQYPESKCYFGRDIIENDYRLWEISDAKEGDVLAVDWNEEDGSVKWQKIVIFKSINKVGVEGYGCTFRNNKLAFDTDVPYYSTTWTHTLKPAIKEQRDLLFQKMKEEGYVWDDEKKELCKINKNKFKVGDWLLDKGKGEFPVLIADYDEEKGYLVKYNIGLDTYFWRDIIENEYRLWTIQDARNGDVLVVNGSSKQYKWIGIFKAHTSDTSFSSHCHYNCGMCEFVTDIARCTKHGAGKHSDIRPATNEECGLLFAKMREAGYTWDEEKKELRKIIKPKFNVGDKIEATIYGINRRVTIRGVDKTNRCYLGTLAECIGFSEQDQWHLAPKPHYDISNFYAGMPVLVRADNNCRWDYSVFSRITGNEDWQFAVCNGVSFTQCIPFEGNETLLGTTDMCNEQYINW